MSDQTALSGVAPADASRDPVHWLDRFEELGARVTLPVSTLGVLGMLVASAATVADVLLRWLFHSGMVALNEIIGIAFAVAVAACIPAGVSRRVNLRVDVLESRFSPRMAALLDATGNILLLIFLGLLAWRILDFAAVLFGDGRRTVMLELLKWPFILTSGVLLAIAALVQAVAAANTIRRTLQLPRPAGPVPASARLMDAFAVVFALAVLAVAILAVRDFTALSDWAWKNVSLTIVLLFAVSWILLLGMVPLAAVVGLVGIFGCALFIGAKPALAAYADEAVGFMTNYQVASLPLFLMMGSFAAAAGVAEDIYRLAHAAFGRYRGGLAMATIGGCAGFGTVSGSSLATVATFGRVALPEMQARGYAPSLSLGCVAAGGTLGALIPPSGILIIFALLTESSIGRLFVAAVIPGLIAVLAYLITVSAIVRFNPSAVPPASVGEKGELRRALKRSGAVVALFGAVIGGMYLGVFTATEAAAVGAFGAFLIALLRGRLGGGNLWNIMAETTTSTAIIYGIIFGVLIFSLFVNVSELTERVTAYISTLQVAPVVIILLILLVYVALGCLMDSVTIMFITVPVVTPVILHLGYDMIWWGIINLVVIEIGQITPPFGLNLFVLKSMTDTRLQTVYKGVLPFCAADFIKLVLLVAVPALALWLPSTMFE